MKLPTNPTTLLLSLLALLSAAPVALAAEVTTEYTETKECTRKSQRGDTISVHYRGTLASDGSQFDASYDRGQPLDFTVGQGMVIKGWVSLLFVSPRGGKVGGRMWKTDNRKRGRKRNKVVSMNLSSVADSLLFRSSDGTKVYSTCVPATSGN